MDSLLSFLQHVNQMFSGFYKVRSIKSSITSLPHETTKMLECLRHPQKTLIVQLGPGSIQACI